MKSFRFALLLAFGAAAFAAPASAQVAARAFAREPQQTIRLGTGRPEACLQVEPVNGSFALSQVFLRSMKLLYANPVPGAPRKIMVVEATIDRDTDRNGQAEICACFAKADLRRMFREVQGRAEIEVRVHAAVEGPGPDNWFEAPVALQIVGDDHMRVLPRSQ